MSTKKKTYWIVTATLLIMLGASSNSLAAKRKVASAGGNDAPRTGESGLPAGHQPWCGLLRSANHGDPYIEESSGRMLNIDGETNFTYADNRTDQFYGGGTHMDAGMFSGEIAYMKRRWPALASESAENFIPASDNLPSSEYVMRCYCAVGRLNSARTSFSEISFYVKRDNEEPNPPAYGCRRKP